jgi:hypothetical protein
MTIEEKLRAAAREITINRGRMQLASGVYLDELMIEAADEIRRIHETFGRTLLEEEERKMVSFFGAQMIEAACSGAAKHAERLARQAAVDALTKQPLPAMGPLEQDFFRRHQRRIDTGREEPFICQGGTLRCDDCRCGLPVDWRDQDAEALAKEGKA